MAENYRVVSQQQTTFRGPDGTFTEGVKVTFQTAHGLYGYVYVTDADYTPENVHAAIAARVEQMEAVANL